MSNPAADLHTIFTSWKDATQSTNTLRRGLSRGTQQVEKHMQAMLLLDKISREIAELKRAGRRVASLERAYPTWIYAVLAVRSGSWNATSDARLDFDQPSMDALEHLADILDHPRGHPINAASRSDARQVMAEVLAAVDADQSLDGRLKQHIRRVIRNLQACIEDFDVLDAEGVAALDAVWAAMQAAAAASTTQASTWEKFRDRFAIPVVVALLAGAPSTVATITAS